MTITDIKAAISAKAKTLNLPPVVPVKIKMCSPDEVVRVYEETATETAPVTKPEPEAKPAAAPKQETKTVTTVEQEVKAAAVTPKKPTTRKTKAATVIPIDGIEAVVAKYLKPKVHFDTINGLGRKPVLLKAGAEKLAEIYGFRTTSKEINRVERFDQLFVLYEVQTTVFDADGHILGEGLGSCTTKERKYQRGDFAANLNTVLKMAKKRSYVDAVLTATHASGVFTQDIEDIAVEARQGEAVG